MVRYSSDSLLSRQLSNASTTSSDSRRNRLSIPQIATADRVSMSRVSSTNSLHGTPSVQKITTPTRRKSQRRSQVSASGSPAERTKKPVLRDISGNATRTTPQRQRQVSISTMGSGRSSNGNPFHWDCGPHTLPKHSALKGSPNARKGHRRQSCVRISTLTPQVLGPKGQGWRSRSASPAAETPKRRARR